MRNPSPLLFALCATALAVVPVQFSAGSPAKADDVNKDFTYLDTAKVDRSTVGILNSAVNAKIDATDANNKFGAKVDTGTYNKYVRDQASKSVIDTVLTKRVTTVEGAASSLANRHDSLVTAVGKLPASGTDLDAKRRIDSLSKVVGGSADTTRLAKGLATKADAASMTSLSARHDSLVGVVGKLPTSTTDVDAKRRIDSLSAAVTNKVDKGAITAGSIHSIADTLGVSKSSLTVNGALIASGGVNATSIVKSTGGSVGEPSFRLVRDNAPTDAKVWDWTTDQAGGSLFLRTIDDVQQHAGWAMKIDRTGYTPTAISLCAPTTVYGSLISTAANFSDQLPITMTASGSGVFDRTALYVYPATSAIKGYYLELPRIADSKTAAPSDFEINVRGGDIRILRYDGTNDIFTLNRPTEVTSDLTVDGTLKAKSTTPWADYVFEPGYQAMPLKDVEIFAKANGHLPEVPSAAEVQKDGIDLARMNAILLKKVEELTLHAVEQEKRMETLAAKVDALEADRK